MTYRQPWFWCCLWPHQPHSAGLSCSCQCPPALRLQSSGSSGRRMFQLGHDDPTQESPGNNKTEKKTHARLRSKPKRWHLKDKAGNIKCFSDCQQTPWKDQNQQSIYPLLSKYSKANISYPFVRISCPKTIPKYTSIAHQMFIIQGWT